MDVRTFTSNTVSRIAYHENRLFVEMRNGTTFSAPGVPERLFREFAENNAPGRFFSSRIKASFNLRREERFPGEPVPVPSKSPVTAVTQSGDFIFPPFADKLRHDIAAGENVLLTGPTGCGKTTLIRKLAEEMEKRLVRVNLNGQMTVSDFVGYNTVTGGTMEWIDGVLPKCLKEGWWLLLDEIDFGDPEILGALNPVLEPGGTLFLKEKGFEEVPRHPDFRMFATANTVGVMSEYRRHYQGTAPLNQAFLRRWIVFHQTYLSAAQEIEVILKTCPTLPREIAHKIGQAAATLRKAFEAEEISFVLSTAEVLDWAKRCLVVDPTEAAKWAFLPKLNRTDAACVEQLITRVFP